MKLQTKLLLGYSILSILIVITISGSYYYQSTKVIEKDAYANLSLITNKMTQQLENLIKPMDFTIEHLIASNDVKSSMASLAYLDDSDPDNRIYIHDATIQITNSLYRDAITKYFYRVSIFNHKGTFLTSNYTENNITKGTIERINNLSWTNDADEAAGKMVILSSYEDPWTVGEGKKVFGVVRAVSGLRGDMGYIEVQALYSEIEKVFTLNDQDNIKVLAMTKEGKIFYNSGITDQKQMQYYLKLSSQGTGIEKTEQNPYTHLDEIIVNTKSDYLGMDILVIQDQVALLKPLSNTAKLIFGFGAMILMVSIVYTYILSRQLTKPIRKLKNQMEEIELSNLNDVTMKEHHNNEVQALNVAFINLRNRLSEAIGQEIKAHSLQMQASLDSLQAQINPHFLYNILNVLSKKGLENGDEEIGEICSSIASMLRYSTSTIKRTTTLQEELEHVNNYLLLMKKRYEHLLEYQIDVQESILNVTLPKIVLQPLVENAISHGYCGGRKVMNITIHGYELEGYWYLEILDEGKGFDEKVLIDLKKDIENMKRSIISSSHQMGFEIGGMGILNTFSRLYLYSQENIELDIQNRPSGGACIILKGIISNLTDLGGQ